MSAYSRFKVAQRILSGAVVLAIFGGSFGIGSLSQVHAQESVFSNPALPVVHTVFNANVLSDSQFVYGPNIGDFKVSPYLESNAPHLSSHADDLYEHAEYFSINPKIYLTFLEIHSHLVSAPDVALMEDPFGLDNKGFISQIETLSEEMSDAYYLHLYSYTSLPVSQRSLPSFVTPDGVTINIAPETNAGTYAIIAGLSAINQQDISLILDNSQPSGFYQTYLRLFENDNPLDKSNNLTLPMEVSTLAAPDNLFQLPYLQGLSWRFGGVHNTAGGTTFTDASSLDFYPNGSVWGMDTSNMWVVAAASGIPTRYSDCGFKVSHSGAVNVGWETTYYHLEGAKFLSGFINQNDKIGIIANTLAEATCTGGAASGPHVHFSLKYNGVYVAIDGTPLSGWYVHAGRWSYDTDPAYMWLERGGVKKYPSYPYSDVLLSEMPPLIVSGNTGVAGEVVSYTGGSTTTDDTGNYSITVVSGWTGTVTPSSPCYTYTPPSRSYTNILSNQLLQNYTPSALNSTCAEVNVDIGGVNRGGYTLPSGQSIVKKYTLDDGPVEISSNNGVGIIASLNQWRRPTPSGGWTGVAQSMALPVSQISNRYVIPRYNGTDPTLYNAVLMANVDSVPRTITVTIGGVVMGSYLLGPSDSRFEVYNVTGGPLVVSSVAGSKIVASLYELKRAGATGEYNGQSEMMGLPATQLSDKMLIPIYFGMWGGYLDASLYFANADTFATVVDVTIGGVSRGTYLMQPNTSMVVQYLLDGGPVEISSNNGAKIVASLNQWRRPSPSSGWTGVAQSMALPMEKISNSYVIPRYNGNDPTLYNAVLMANVDTVPRTITVEIGGVVMGSYLLGPSDSRFEVYPVTAGPLVVSSVAGSKIVASLYELKRAESVGEYNGQSEMMGLPSTALSDKYLIPIYFGMWGNYLDASLYIGVP